jgi:hypothetical protein
VVVFPVPIFIAVDKLTDIVPWKDDTKRDLSFLETMLKIQIFWNITRYVWANTLMFAHRHGEFPEEMHFQNTRCCLSVCCYRSYRLFLPHSVSFCFSFSYPPSPNRISQYDLHVL